MTRISKSKLQANRFLNNLETFFKSLKQSSNRDKHLAFEAALLQSMLHAMQNSTAPTHDPTRNFKRTRKLLPFHIFIAMSLKSTASLASDLGRLPMLGGGQGNVSECAFYKAIHKLTVEPFYQMFQDSVHFCISHLPNKQIMGFKLFAIDGSLAMMPRDPRNTKTSIKEKEGARSVNTRHIDAIVEIPTGIVWNASLCEESCSNERTQAMRLIEKTKFPKEPILFTADRGYPAWYMLVFMELHQFSYVFRSKDRSKKCMLSALHLPEDTSLDITLQVHLTERAVEEDACGYKYTTYEVSREDNPKSHHSGKTTQIITLRIVRIPATTSPTKNKYGHIIPAHDEMTLVTNLPKERFDAEDLEEIYHLRWGIETAYYYLKNLLGVLEIHSKNPEYQEKEVISTITFYNYIRAFAQSVNPMSSGKWQNPRKGQHINLAAAANTFKEVMKSILLLVGMQRYTSGTENWEKIWQGAKKTLEEAYQNLRRQKVTNRKNENIHKRIKRQKPGRVAIIRVI